MATATTAPFTGFRREGIQFLADLAANNERTWFQPRKADYERLLKEPLEAFCVAVDAEFRLKGVSLRADPAKSPFRIYRDVRFSKNKSPYKTHLAASFFWVAPDGTVGRHDGEGVGGYFNLQPGEMYVGGGAWQPSPAYLAAWRRAVVERGAEVHAAIGDARFKRTFGSISGEGYKRVPAGAPADHPDAELLKMKQVLFGTKLSDADVESRELPSLVAESLAAAMPVMRLLASLTT